MGNGIPPVTGNLDNTSGFLRRQSSSAHYWSPAWGGFSIRAAYGANEERTATRNPWLASVSATWESGNWYVAAAYDAHNDYQLAGTRGPGRDRLGGVPFRRDAHRRGGGAAALRDTHRYAAPRCVARVLGAVVGPGLADRDLRARSGRRRQRHRAGRGIRAGSDTGAWHGTVGYEYAFSNRTRVQVLRIAALRTRRVRPTSSAATRPGGSRAGAPPSSRSGCGTTSDGVLIASCAWSARPDSPIISRTSRRATRRRGRPTPRRYSATQRKPPPRTRRRGTAPPATARRRGDSRATSRASRRPTPARSRSRHAIAAPSVHYSVQPAEATTFASASFDAVCVAQALHWFDIERFYAEVRRVLRPGGIPPRGRLRVAERDAGIRSRDEAPRDRPDPTPLADAERVDPQPVSRRAVSVRARCDFRRSPSRCAGR
jgi:hypothetical protein